MARIAIELPIGKIKAFCDKWKVSEFALFGSVLRDDFRPDSDIDVMVQFHSNAHPTFATLDWMEEELESMFHRDDEFIENAQLQDSVASRRMLTTKTCMNGSIIRFPRFNDVTI